MEELEAAEARFVVDSRAYHLSVSRLVENLNVNFDSMGRLPALIRCRSLVADIVITALGHRELDEELRWNESQIPYETIANPERPGQFNEEAENSAAQLFESGNRLDAVSADPRLTTRLDELCRELKRTHGFITLTS